MKKYLMLILLPLGFGLLTSPIFAQSEDEDENVYDLSPFEIDASGDTGYLASQTLSGTRLRSSLQDVAASITVYTEEFINDLQILNEAELTRYTLNQDLTRSEYTGGVFDIPYEDARQTVRGVTIRGLDSTPAVNYFQRVFSGDSYNVGRYDESRGPNSILFGIGDAGGISNSTTLQASLGDDFGRIRLTTETTGGLRGEFRYNKVLVEDKLAITVAAVEQEFDGYKHWSWSDASRLYGAIKYQISDNFTIKAYGETGNRNVSNENLGAIGSWGMMVWKDWSDAVGVENLVLEPANRNPTNAEREYGIFNRTANANGATERFVVVTNDGAFFNDAGEFQTVEYGSTPVRGPNGWAPPPNNTGGNFANQRLKIYRKEFIDPKTTLSGPGQYRDEDFSMIGASMDIKVTENWFFELAYNTQEIDIFAPTTQGFNWQVSADPNTTRGVPTYANGDPNPGFGGPNPFAGGFFTESNWGLDTGAVDQEAARVTMSLSHDFAQQDMAWLGSHNFAILAQRAEFSRFRSNKWFGFIGAPFSTNWNSADNRLQLRYYFPFEDLTQNSESVHLAHWEDFIGQSMQYDGNSYELGWYNRNANPGQNSGFMNDITSQLAVLQSYWWENRLVTTLGARKDEQDDTQFGYTTDPVYGPMVDTSIIGNTSNFDGETYTAGTVFKAFTGEGFVSGIDLVANYSSSIGIPDSQQSILPDGGPPPPPEGTGRDYGIQFRLMDDRILGRIVYYEVENIDSTQGGAGPSTDLQRITDALGTQLISQGLYTDASWAEEIASRGMDIEWNGYTFDQDSEGWEFSLVANPTDSWRIALTGSKVDRRRFDNNGDVADAYGYVVEDDPSRNIWLTEDSPYTQWKEGFLPDDEGVWRLQNASDFTPDGWVSQLIELGQLIDVEGENFETFGLFNGQSMTQIIGQRLVNLNRGNRQSERRQGLRPYRANLFTAYDFKEGALKGFTIGGGFNWQDKAVVGIDSVTKGEVYGPDLLQTNMLLRYSWQNSGNFLPGLWHLQINVDNVLNDDDPVILTPHGYFDEIYIYDLPNNWGQAATRVNIIKPINARISLTYEF